MLQHGLHRHRRPHRRRHSLGALEPGRSDADDHGRRPVERDDTPDDRRVRAKVGSPEGVAEHEHRRGAVGPTLARGEAAADRGRDAEHLEVVARGEGADHRARLASAQQHLDERLVRRKPRERPRAVAVHLVLGVREEAGHPVHAARAACVDALSEADQAVAAGKRQGLEGQAVDNREDRGVDANPESHRPDGGGGEARIVPERPHGVQHVAPERLDRRSRACASHRLLHLLEAAQFQSRLPFGLLARHAALHPLLHRTREVGAQLRVHLALLARPAEEIPDCGEQAPHEVASMAQPMAVATRSQFSSASATWRRPCRVSL